VSVRVLAVAVAALLCIAGALLAPAGATDKDDPPRLDAVVGTNDGFDIALNDASGKLVTRLAPGTYTIVVHDRSALHNFHLASNVDRTVDFKTTVPFVGDMTFVVTFLPGIRYAYACEPHFEVMNGQFFIDSAPTTTSPATTSPAPPPVRRMNATVSASGVATLRPASLAPARVRLTVVDRSKLFNFHLVGPGVNRRTTRAFVGSTTWSLKLAAGTYRYGSDPGKLRKTLRVG
jgi:hypothetical protein